MATKPTNNTQPKEPQSKSVPTPDSTSRPANSTSRPAKRSFDELAKLWGDETLIDMLDGLGYQAKTEYLLEDPELLALQAVYAIMSKEKVAIAHAIAVHQGNPIPTEDPKQSASQNGKPSESSDPPSDAAPAQLLQLQKSDAELMQQATALELVNIAKRSRFQTLARQAFVKGLRPKDPQLAKLYDIAEQEVRRYQELDPCQLPFFIQPEGGEVDQITIEMIAFDSTLDLADPTKTDAASLLELLYEPVQATPALLEGRLAQLKLTAAA
jgi:hypothetical protein